MLDTSEITRIVEKTLPETLRGRAVNSVETTESHDWLGEPTLHVRIVLKHQPDDDHWYEDAARTSTVIGEALWERGERRVPQVQFTSQTFVDLFDTDGRLKLVD